MWVDAELVNAQGGEKGNERNWERERTTRSQWGCTRVGVDVG